MHLSQTSPDMNKSAAFKSAGQTQRSTVESTGLPSSQILYSGENVQVYKHSYTTHYMLYI